MVVAQYCLVVLDRNISLTLYEIRFSSKVVDRGSMVLLSLLRHHHSDFHKHIVRGVW